MQRARVFFRVVTDQRDALHALAVDLLDELRHSELAVDRLAAGHRDRVVVQDLVGDVDAGSHRGADRENAGVEVGAVAEVLEHVLRRGERRLPDPGRALAAHLREGIGAALHPRDHVVAADTAAGAAALGHHGRGVVRAARTVVRRAFDDRARRGQRLFLAVEEIEPPLHVLALVIAADAARDRARDHRRREFRQVGQQRAAVLVVFADHARAALHRPVVELPGELVLDDRALLLDHEDFLEPPGEGVGGHRIQRPRHADLEHADAELGGLVAVDAEILERLQHVEPGLAGGHDAKTRTRAVDRDVVQVVHARELARRVDLVEIQALFLRQRRVVQPGVHAAGRQPELLGNLHADTVRVDVDGGGGIAVLGDHLEADPAAAVARQLPA